MSLAFAQKEPKPAPVPTARQWLRANYPDIDDVIEIFVSEWKRARKKTRRDWLEVLGGDKRGRPRKVNGVEFPVLRAARLRQELPLIGSERCDNPLEPAAPAVQREWSEDSDRRVFVRREPEDG
jgi:hypothetical protein